MVELKTQNPFIDEDGEKREGLEKHWAEDKNGDRYYILQNETGIEYSEAVDVTPCRYTYTATNKKVEILSDNE